jgi:hypothetical protein
MKVNNVKIDFYRVHQLFGFFMYIIHLRSLSGKNLMSLDNEKVSNVSFEEINEEKNLSKISVVRYKKLGYLHFYTSN